MSDRRVVELSAAELLEEAMRLLGWSDGSWEVRLLVEDGHVRRARPHSVDRPQDPPALGRRELDRARAA